MLKISLLSLLLASNAMFANPQIKAVGDHYDVADAYHSGTGKVYHDGDFIEFTLSFDSSCYADRAEAWNHVANNVATFSEWLNLERANYETDALVHDIEPITIWRRDAHSYDVDGCGNTYTASQIVKLKLNRNAEASALNVDSIQAFYADLQAVVWPLNQESLGDLNSRYSTTISNIEKGLYEETADSLRVLAKNLAREKATKDFLSTLGEDFSRGWYLISADYREQDHSNYYRSNVEIYPGAALPPVPGVPGIPVESSLKLKPLSISVFGNFHYVYDIK